MFLLVLGIGDGGLESDGVGCMDLGVDEFGDCEDTVFNKDVQVGFLPTTDPRHQ